MIALLVLSSLAGQADVWTVERVVARAVETSNAVAEARAVAAESEAARKRALIDVLPRASVGYTYTRVSPLDNDPLVEVPLDFDQLDQSVGQVQDPSAQAVLRAQVDVLRGLNDATIQVPEERQTLTASLVYPLSRALLELGPALSASGKATEAKSLLIEAARNDAALRAVESYADHALAQEGLRVAKLALNEARMNLEQARARLESDFGTRPEVLRFEAREAEAEEEVAMRAADVAVTGAALRALLDLEGSGPLPVADTLDRVRVNPVEAGSALRPELRAIELSRDAAEIERKARLGGVAPALDLAGQIDSAQPNPLLVPPNTEDFRTNWILSVVLSWSPDRAASAAFAAREARARRDGVDARLRALEDLIRVEVEQARARLAAAQVSQDTGRRQVEAATEALSGLREGYTAGLQDATEVIAAEVQLSRARLALARSGARLMAEEARLRRALGVPLTKAPK